MILIPLILLLILVPIAELYVIIQVGQEIGAGATVALLLATSVLGGVLLRSQGRLAWRRFRGALAAGRPPGREVLDGALVLAGGAMLLVPGFLSDVLGLVLLLPPTRVLARSALMRGARGRALAAAVAADAASRRRARQDYDVDSTAHDIDSPTGRLRG